MTGILHQAKQYFLGLQSSIIEHLEGLDGRSFAIDQWDRPEGGGGISRVIEKGALFERGGCNFSHVMGDRLPPSASAHRPELAGRRWEAMGVSLVLHPHNPYVPTVHMNVRLFMAFDHDHPDHGSIGWCGGGMDLTPYYGFEDDARHFHQHCKNALDSFGSHWHPRFKRWCDDYFFLKHRQEARGIGGIFFDDLSEPNLEQAFALTRSVGDHFLQAYVPIVEKRRSIQYGDASATSKPIDAVVMSNSIWSLIAVPCLAFSRTDAPSRF